MSSKMSMVPCLLLGSERRCDVIRVSNDSVDLCGIYALCRILDMLLCVRYLVSLSVWNYFKG